MHRRAKAVCLHFALSVQLVFCILVHVCLCVHAGVCLTVCPHQSHREMNMTQTSFLTYPMCVCLHLFLLLASIPLQFPT